jgi:hypothetical protein
MERSCQGIVFGGAASARRTRRARRSALGNGHGGKMMMAPNLDVLPADVPSLWKLDVQHLSILQAIS